MTTSRLSPPTLSAFDPAQGSEGSIDPLGTQRIYERLAERIFPFMTVRMSRPRFLTAMVVGSCVCERIDDEVGVDGVTPPWLVFEWHVVEAFCRRTGAEASAGAWGIPGMHKVRASLDKTRHVDASGYLKTPKIFGFSGIYRRLARGLGILDDDLVREEAGERLLEVWEKEQGLSGFGHGAWGVGAELREELRRAVRQGLAKGRTCQKESWHVWEAICRHLDPATVGREEGRLIHELLCRAGAPGDDATAIEMRSEMLGQLEQHGPVVRMGDEPTFFRGLRGHAGAELTGRLEVIDAFEGVCRPIEDAFRLALHVSAKGGLSRVTASGFAEEPEVRAITGRLPPAVERAEGLFRGTQLEEEVAAVLAPYRGVREGAELFDVVVAHHEKVQQQKPPHGKVAWVVRDGGGIVVRPTYAVDKRPKGGDDYVHWYRTGTATTFLQDLGRLPR